MKTFGLIGYPLSHSFSPAYFAGKFEREQIEDCEYHPFELKRIEDFKALVEEKALSGLNVTIPYKQAIIPFLDELSPTAQAIGAVNTIQFTGGKLIGHNTDVIGFERSIQPLLQAHHQKAYILGTGGAAKAVAYALQSMGLTVQYVSRTASEQAISYDELIIQKGDVLINTTPLGMYPKVDACLNIPYAQLDETNILFDLVYNPETTLLMQKGIAQGAIVKNGLEMLHLQAEAAWEIWSLDK